MAARKFSAAQFEALTPEAQALVPVELRPRVKPAFKDLGVANGLSYGVARVTFDNGSSAVMVQATVVATGKVEGMFGLNKTARLFGEGFVGLEPKLRALMLKAVKLSS
jgi:hypothetical protein